MNTVGGERQAASATRFVAFVALVAFVLGACGGGDGSDAPAPEGATGADERGDSTDDPSGLEIEVLGWSRAPYPEGADDIAVGFGGKDYVALHVEACLGSDAEVSPEHVGVITVGDADGDPFDGGHWQRAPVASPTGFEPPGPGGCAEGWLYPAFERGLEPASAVWLDVTGSQGGDRWWPLGDPYPPGPLPVFGDVRDVGEPWDVADGASWTVHGVSVAGPGDPVPSGDLDDGMAWVVIDAEYCAGTAPGTIHESLGVVVDGWAGRGRPRTVEAAVEPAGTDGCERRPVAVAMPVGMSVTAVTGTDHSGPWWPVDPPVEIGD